MSEQYWGNVQSQLDRKYDLITILTNVIKSHSAENSDAANELLEAKLKAMQSFTPFQKALTEKSLDDSISKIFEISETYQDLIKDEKFLKIKEDINSVKKELTVSSSYYNAIIRDYNSKISSFPSSLVAKMLGHYNKETFDVDLNFQNTNKTQ
jgi:LemA protein